MNLVPEWHGLILLRFNSSQSKPNVIPLDELFFK